MEAKSWINPIEKLSLKAAVLTKERSITLQGRRFNIQYKPDKVFVSPQEGYLPCGWFNRKKIEDWPL